MSSLSKLSDIWKLKNPSSVRSPNGKFIKRRCNFDQKFINCQDDVPLDKRRTGMLFESCSKLGSTQGRAHNLTTCDRYPNQQALDKASLDQASTGLPSHQLAGKMIFNQKLPDIQREVVAKSHVFTTRNFAAQA